MRIEDKPNKRTIEFEKIREGTVLTCDGRTYVKGTGGSATDLETGQVVYPANDAAKKWDKCLIYPGAYVSLHGRPQEETSVR